MVTIWVVMGLVAGLGLAVAVRAGVLVARRGAVRVSAVDLALFGLGTVVALCLGYGLLVEPRWLEVTQQRWVSDKLPPGQSLRVVQFSDLHSPSNPSVQRELPAVIRFLEPDLIVFTGDLANSAEGLALAKPLLREIARIAPSFGIRGDVDTDAEDLFADTGFVELRGNLLPVEVRGLSISLVGWSQQSDWKKVYGTISQANKEPFLLFLSHSPDLVETVAPWGVDLSLAGHTHGGQVALPFYGALWTASLFGKRYEAGRYQVGETELYINRGLGMARTLPPVRFLSRPELTLHVIEGGDS